MTIEEIEKAAEEYATNLCVSTFDYKAARKDFREGADFANKHWQEKTRWIPVEERLPNMKADEYPIYAKNEREKSDYAILIIDDQSSLEYLKKAFTHWKEIE